MPACTFTKESQQLLAYSRHAARELHHNYISTEHLLLAMAKLEQEGGMNCLASIGLDPKAVREKIIMWVGHGEDTVFTGSIPYTPRIKKVLALSGKLAKRLHHFHIGTEHLLYALFREGEGLAARVLKDFGITLDRARLLFPNADWSEDSASVWWGVRLGQWLRRFKT